MLGQHWHASEMPLKWHFAGVPMTGTLLVVQWKLFIATFFITAKFFTMSIVFAQMYQFSLKLNSLQQKFSLTSNYLGTNNVAVKRVDCIWIPSSTKKKKQCQSWTPSEKTFWISAWRTLSWIEWSSHQKHSLFYGHFVTLFTGFITENSMMFWLVHSTKLNFPSEVAIPWNISAKSHTWRSILHPKW